MSSERENKDGMLSAYTTPKTKETNTCTVLVKNKFASLPMEVNFKSAENIYTHIRTELGLKHWTSAGIVLVCIQIIY